MAFLTELGEVLHEEHFRILSLICGLENRVIGAEGRRPIDPRDEDEKEHLQELIVSLDQIIDHNAFEEAVLFPGALRQTGDLQHRPGQPVHQRCLHRSAGERRHPDLDGRPRPLAG